MGGSSSRSRRRNEEAAQQQQRQPQPTAPQPTAQRTVARPSANNYPAFNHYPAQHPGVQFPQWPPPQFAPMNQHTGGHSAGELRDVATIRNLCTLLPKSVKIVVTGNTAEVSFACHTTVRATVEVHVAIRERVRHGAVIFTPNQPKPPPVPMHLDIGEAVEVRTQVDLTNVSLVERAFDPKYPKQIPVAITLAYAAEVRETDGSKSRRTESALQVEYTYLSILPETKILKRMLQVPGAGLFAMEALFGAESEQGGVTMATVATEEGGRSPAAGSPEAEAAAADEEALCVICITNPKDTAVMPCRHLCLCKECAEELRRQSNRCPICRGPISQLVAKKR